jgi:hypothetical protein
MPAPGRLHSGSSLEPTSGETTRRRSRHVCTWSTCCRRELRACKVLSRLSCSAAELSRGRVVRSIGCNKVLLRLSARRRQRRRRHELTIILLVTIRWSSSEAVVVVVDRRKAVTWQVVIPVLLLRLVFRCTSRQRHVVVERALCLGCAGSDRRSKVFLRRRQSRRGGSSRPVGGSRRVVSESTVKRRANLCVSLSSQRAPCTDRRRGVWRSREAVL